MAARARVKKATERMGTLAFVGGVLVVGIVAIVGVVLMGKSDNGQIDVTAAIKNSNQANTDAGGEVSGNVEAIPDTFKNMTNGGLVSQGEQPTVPTEEVQAPEVATTTEEDAVATTSAETSAVLEEPVTTNAE